jgi:hypothetical protein
MNRGGFPWKRLLGISQAKARLSRKIGIPLTRPGSQRKIGAAWVVLARPDFDSCGIYGVDYVKSVN